MYTIYYADMPLEVKGESENKFVNLGRCTFPL